MAGVVAQDVAVQDPPKKVTRRKKEKTQTELRDELFAKGSDFKETNREDIVGIDNVMDDIDEVIHYLCNCSLYRAYGARLEPGIVFEGEPGTGKTLVSRYIATKANAWFINVREFAMKDKFPSPADIRDLFRRARKLNKKTDRPVILFWDEFDIVAQERGSDHTTTEEASVTSQLTTELDGIEGKDAGILLIGCTNYAWRIDKALVRSGRMGLQIEFHAPSREGKQQILTHYLNKVKCKADIDTETLSFFFARGDTAADIEESVMEAWRYAVRRSLTYGPKPTIALAKAPILEQRDLMEVFLHRLVGPATNIDLPEDEMYQVAVHETGHAIMALVAGVPLRLITIRPGRKSLGRVMYDDIQEYTGTQDHIVDRIRIALASLAAESQAGLPAMLGGNSDIHSANEMACRLIDEFNHGGPMGSFNLAAFGNVRRSDFSKITPQISDATVHQSDQEVARLLKGAEQYVYDVMRHIGQGHIVEIATAVQDRVTLTGREFAELFESVTRSQPSRFRP